MDLADVQRRLLDAYGVRVEPEMGEYVRRRLTDAAPASSAPLAVMGGDARTGSPVHVMVDPKVLQSSLEPKRAS